MVTEQTVCPDCAGPVEADRDRLCPRCGYPLMFLETEPAPEAAPIGRKPGEREDATIVLAPVQEPSAPEATDEPLAAGENRCESCGEHNPGTRIRCERCGHHLRRSDQVVRPAPAPQSSTDPPRVVPSWAIVVAVAAVVASVVAAVLVWKPWDSTGDPVDIGRAPEVVVVDRGVISAKASSTMLNDPDRVAKKTLDGDPRTAWQSDGKRIDTNRGVRLTYTFNREVQLARITVINGESWSPKGQHKNEWIKECVVAAGGRTWEWTMPETGEPPSKTDDFGLIREVTLTVTAVYPSTKYEDLAVAEVSFGELR